MHWLERDFITPIEGVHNKCFFRNIAEDATCTITGIALLEDFRDSGGRFTFHKAERTERATYIINNNVINLTPQADTIDLIHELAHARQRRIRNKIGEASITVLNTAASHCHLTAIDEADAWAISTIFLQEFLRDAKPENEKIFQHRYRRSLEHFSQVSIAAYFTVMACTGSPWRILFGKSADSILKIPPHILAGSVYESWLSRVDQKNSNPNRYKRDTTQSLIKYGFNLEAQPQTDETKKLLKIAAAYANLSDIHIYESYIPQSHLKRPPYWLKPSEKQKPIRRTKFDAQILDFLDCIAIGINNKRLSSAHLIKKYGI